MGAKSSGFSGVFRYLCFIDILGFIGVAKRI